MSNYFDYEEAIKNVKSKKIQEYLHEVLSTYFNGEYRSCIVMLYATTFADALYKIKIMSEEYQNDNATKFLEDYENSRKANKAYSSLERDVVDFIAKSGLINDVERKQWEHLKDYRDYCAHPVVEKEYELISPNNEQVRMHIRNMFEALFLKDAILVDNKVFDEFVTRIESFYDRNGRAELEEYVNSRYINKLDYKTKCKFIKNLWKFVFFINDDECDKYRIPACWSLIWIINSDKSNLLSYISNDISYFNGKIDFQDITLSKDEKVIPYFENKTLTLLFFLYKVPEIYSMLSAYNQAEIKSVSKKNINLILISPYLYENSNAHVEELLNSIKGYNYCVSYKMANNLLKRAYNRFDYSYNRFLIYYFFNCQNSTSWHPDFDYINWTYENLISVSLPYFTKGQIEDFLSNLTDSYVQAHCFKEMASLILNIDKEKNYEIDFSVYDIDITKKLED